MKKILGLIIAFAISIPAYASITVSPTRIEINANKVKNNYATTAIEVKGSSTTPMRFKAYTGYFNISDTADLKILDGELISNTVPNGVLGDIVQLRGETVQKKNLNSADYYLPIECLPKNSLSILEYFKCDIAESSLTKFYKDDILLGAMRVYFHRVCIAPFDGITRTTCFVLKPAKSFYKAFSVAICNLNETIQYYKSLKCGANEDVYACEYRITQSTGNSLPSVGTFARPMQFGYIVRGFGGKYGHLGYDLSSKHPFRLMQGRLGIYDKYCNHKQQFPS